MREYDRGQRIGRKGLIRRRYKKTRGRDISISTLIHWDRMHLFDDCIDHVSRGGMRYYDVTCVMRRIDKILFLKKGRATLTEIRRIIYNNLNEERRKQLLKEGWIE